MSDIRVQRPFRDQVRLVQRSLDDLVREDHPVRVVWAYVERLNLADFEAKIRARVGKPGRPPIDPRILLALWIYATLRGIASAREVGRLCEVHDEYRWICGDVPVNYHTIADFRSENETEFEALLAQHVAALAGSGAVELDTVVQDGVRVRANAGSASFRTAATLKEQHEAAKALVSALRVEAERDSGAASRRKAKAQERAAREREARVADALKRATELAELRQKSMGHKSKDEQDKMKRKVAKGEVRASRTDPDAHRMKMADGGFRPAYNGQVAMDPASRVIVGARLTNDGLDGSQLPPMADHLERTLKKRPTKMVADGGFANHAALIALEKKGGTAYVPVDKPRSNRDPHTPLSTDAPAIAAWRVRMGTEEGKAIFARRPIVEWAFARFRNWGLRQFPVRGRARCASVFQLLSIVHNFSVANECKLTMK